MECLLCGHSRAHQHGKTKKGIQRYKCPHCERTFPENLNSLYYNRHLSPEEVHTILQSHAEGALFKNRVFWVTKAAQIKPSLNPA